MANANYRLDDLANVNRTTNSQRTLVTPPGSDYADSLEGAVGGLNPSRTPRILWADQMMMGASDGRSGPDRLSLDSRFPAQNNLQTELDRAARMQLSMEGFPLPFRGVPSSTRLERVEEGHPETSQMLPVDLTGFSGPRAATTRQNSTNPFWNGDHPETQGPAGDTGLREPRNQTLNGSFLLPRDDAVPLLNSTVQPIFSSGIPTTNGGPTMSRSTFDSQPLSSNQGHRMLGAVQTDATAFQSGAFRVSNGESGVSTQYIPGRTEETAQTCRQEPGNERETLQNYVHVSEIQNYVQTYVRQLLTGHPNRPIVPDTTMNHLAQEIGEIGLRDTGVPGVSRTADRAQVSSQDPPRLPAPLQMRITDMSGVQPENRGSSINDETPQAFREVLRNSWPSFVNPGYPRSPVGPTARDQLPEPRLRMNYPLNASPNVQPINEEGTQYQMRRGRLPHQTCNIMEKWPKFAGDANPTPVIDFLRQIELLSRSYQISKEELRTHAHLLFKEDAYVWYSAYEPKFNSWDTLLYYLRMRYDNPNRDRFIREDLRNRKQRPNELFSAFLTDIENLSQRMNKRISDEEKFDIVVENMKMSYKRRLALEEISSLEHLAQLCYRFDALEGNLYHPRGPTKTPLVNEIFVDEKEAADAEDLTDELEVAALQARRNPKDPSTSNIRATNDRIQSLCWNCRKSGHLWRECDQKKGIFCHMCGHPDTTAFRCPQQHDLRTAFESKPKND
ncbi:uncharacterized protein LOC134287765 [Aedes albopictus]|uniref:CCHC-type domain-containing protein n=1 Tax=Aedes albopictus TaxID=7160 RepID=A0ABM1ZL68_AEDAL